MSIKKAVRAILPFSLLAGVVTFSFAPSRGYRSESTFTHPIAEKHTELLDDPTPLDSATLKVKLLSSSISKTAQTFNISFSTGGVGWYNGTSIRRTVLVSSEDPEFEPYYEEFNAKTDDEKNAMLEEEGFEPRFFDAYIYSIVTTKEEIVIPKQLWRGGTFDIEEKITDESGQKIDNPNYGTWKDGWFCLQPTSINNPVATSWNKSKVKNIYIPSTITTISENAFEGIPDTVTIHLEYPQDEVPVDFAPGWNHDATVEYGYDYETNYGFNPEETSVGYQNAILPQFKKDFGDKDVNFYLGYYSEEQRRPLTISYKIMGSDEVKEYSLPGPTQTELYDAVGDGLIAFTVDLSCDIPIGENEQIDPESLVLSNIFSAKEVTDGEKTYLEPDFATVYSAGALQSYGKPTIIDDFVSFKYEGLSTFIGYTNIRMTAYITNYDIYSILKPSFYKQYENELTSKKYSLRYRITSLANVDFYATYDDEEVVVKVLSPISQTILTKENGNLISFLVRNDAFGEGFSTKKLQSFAFKSLSVTIDIISNEGKPIARSTTSARFANVVIMPFNQNGASYFDINAFLLIEALSFIAIYVIVSVILYFYLKNKYKNDEFRRMNKKSFLKKTIMSLVGSLIVLLEATFIVLRTGVFADSVVVFNPTDVFIIVLGILSILIIGYFARYVYLSIKASNERRRSIKLKLDEDVADDGTK